MAVVIAAAGLSAGAGAPASSGASGQHTLTWLAAGDSYSSGQGVAHHSGPCARATGDSTTWAQAAAAELQDEGFAVGTPKLVACTGATTAGFFSSQSGHPAQWNEGMGQFDIVSFSFGGDNVGFRRILTSCFLRNRFGYDDCTDAYVRSNVRKLAAHYKAFLEQVAREAVKAGGQVLVMGYPKLIESPDLWASLNRFTHQCQGFDMEDSNFLRSWAGALNAAIGNAVHQAAADPPPARHDVTFTFINPVSGGNGISPDDQNLFEPTSGTRHELCSQGDENWLNGLELTGALGVAEKLVAGLNSHLPLSVALEPALKAAVERFRVNSASFHPNEAGELAMGELAAEVVGTRLGASSPLATTLNWPQCPTTALAGPYDGPPPPTITAGILLAGLPPMAAYGDNEGLVAATVPSGSSCTASIAEDGTELLRIANKNNDLLQATFITSGAELRYGLTTVGGEMAISTLVAPPGLSESNEVSPSPFAPSSSA